MYPYMCTVRQPDDVLRDLKDSQQKYKYMETQLVKKKASLFMREPEIKKCLEALKLLKSRKGEDSTHLNFGLADQVYARAKLSQDVDSVHLWLGAGIMVEYPLHEAEDLLEAQLDVCQKQLLSCEADYNYIRDQITTTEVCQVKQCFVVVQLSQ